MPLRAAVVASGLAVVATLAVVGTLATPAVATAAGTPAQPVAATTGAATCAPQDGAVVAITTGDVAAATSAGVEVNGRARVSDDHTFTAWFEYRVVGASDWRTTARRNVSTNACGQGWFEATLRDLAADATYEFRAVSATANDTARGNASMFATGPEGRLAGAGTTPSTTPATSTPAPCPNFRGAMGLCTSTPTRQPAAGPDEGRTEPAVDDVRPAGTDARDGVAAWLGGLLPLLSWVAAVLVAPVVLGLLVGADALHGRRE